MKAATATDCLALVDEGFRGSCGLVESQTGSAIWVTEARPTGTGPDETRALLWVARPNEQWSLALRASDTGVRYNRVTAREPI